MRKDKSTKKYYWLASQQLGVGSIAEPGTWYKIVSSTPGHNHALLEEVYERVRVNDFPSMPSRQKSMFLFQDKDIAVKFREINEWRHTDLYEVNIVNKSAKSVELNPNLILIYGANRLLNVVELEVNARQYWSLSALDCNMLELLVESPIEIIHKVEL